MSDAERDEFEFEPIEDLGDAEAAGDELAETLEPLGTLDDDDLAEAAEMAEATDDAEPADAIEPLDDAEMGDIAEGDEPFGDDAAFPAEAGLAAFAADGEAEEEAEAEDDDEEDDEKPEKKKKGKLLASIREASPYTVMLILAFIALLMGTLCLIGELNLYEFDIKAEKAKRGSAMSRPSYSVPDSSTLAACPTCEKLDFNVSEELA